MRMFPGHAADAIAAELELHGTLLDKLGIPALPRWISTCGGDEYSDAMADVISELNRVSHGLSEDELARVHRHFRTTSR
jgi:hypothetical protein